MITGGPKGRPKGYPHSGGGSRLGKPNKNTKAIKDMVLKALEMKGGEKYLAAQADKNPAAFMALLGRVLPLQLTGANDGPVQFTKIERVIVDAAHAAEAEQRDDGPHPIH